MLMPSNNMSGVVHFLAGRFPGKIGLLMSPEGYRPVPDYMPYALDNGAFTGFDEAAFLTMLARPEKHKPMWVAVPDVVGDAEATSRQFHEWKDRIAFPLAFCAQDGHEPQDVPEGVRCVFVGGTTEWKLANAHKFKGVAEWLHIGRVNTLRRLDWAERIGADSVDGTGWFRGGKETQDRFLQHFYGRRQSCFTF